MEGLYRNLAATLLTLASLALQLTAKNRGFGETVLRALVGWGLIYLAGMCLDGPQSSSVKAD